MIPYSEMGQRWEHFPHGADVGIRGVGTSLAGAFEQAALAMTAAIVDPGTVLPVTRIDINCEAPNDELLLVDWLNALIYEMAARQMLFARFSVQIGDHRLSGQAWGERIDPARHQTAVEVKGATYTALHVAKNDDSLWYAECVVDV